MSSLIIGGKGSVNIIKGFAKLIKEAVSYFWSNIFLIIWIQDSAAVTATVVIIVGVTFLASILTLDKSIY